MYEFGLDDDEISEIIPEEDGASLKSISGVEKKLGITLPDDYVRFMRYSNGCTIVPGVSSEIVLFTIEELLNDREEAVEMYEGAVFFGSDGGLESYAFDIRTSPVTIVEVDRVAGMDSAIATGSTLKELIHYVYHKFDGTQEDASE